MGDGVGRSTAGSPRRVLASPLGRELGPAGIATLIGKARRRTLAKGDVLIRQGTGAGAAFLVMSGRLDAVVEVDGREHHVGTAGPGDLVGELALLVGDRRSATVRAAARTEVAPVTQHRLRATLAAHPATAARLAEEAVRQLRQAQLLRELTATFGTLSPEALTQIEGLVEWVSLRAGEVLFEQGDDGDAGYLVIHGRLRATRTDPTTGAAEVVGELGRGDLCGESAVLEDARRNATVDALRDSHLVRLSRDAYRTLLEVHPAAALGITRAVVQRAQGTSKRTARPVMVAVVPCGEPAVADELVAELLEELGPSTCAVSSATLDEALGVPGMAHCADDDPAALRLAHWLQDLEDRHQLVLLRVDKGWTGWTERALRTADTVLLVADATADPAPSPLERELHRFLARRRRHDVVLTLRHPTDVELPSGTRRWLDARPVTAHHHVRRGDRATVARLARHLSGTATSLVLGGGGARGFAHLGVAQVLEELDLPIDAVGGASIGAVMATTFGMGWSADRSRRTAVEAFTDLFDYTVPTVALLRGERISTKLEGFLGDLDIADLWVPYFCVSTNLTTASLQVHDRGSLVRAVRASIAIPGVLPPVPHEGQLLVDGGLLDNVPVSEMRRRNPTGTVLAIDVAPVEGPAADLDYGLSARGLRAWRQRRREGSGPPSLLTTMVRSTLIASVRDREDVVRGGVADLYLEVGVDGGGMLDFSSADSIADGGATAVRPVLERFVREGPAAVGRHVAVAATSPTDEAEPSPTASPGAPDDGPSPAVGASAVGVVLLTLRDLQHRALRFAAVILGTAVVFTLLFLMIGLVEQFHTEPRDAVAALGADGWVVPEGASGAFTSGATMPADTAELIEATVATPIVVSRLAILDDGEPIDVVIVGVPPGGLGQPTLRDGRMATGPNELVIDDSAGLSVGDTTQLGDRSYQVTGLSDRTTMFAGMPFVFLELGEAQALLFRGEPLATTILVSGPALLPEGLTLLEPEAIAEDGMRPLERSISSVALVQVLLWFVAAMIIGTMVYLSSLERRRDVAVLTAIGASRRQLGASIALQAVVTGLVSALAAAILQRFVVPVFPLEVTVPGSALVQVPALAVVVSLAAGGIGLRTALRTDPALAFSGPGG